MVRTKKFFYLALFTLILFPFSYLNSISDSKSSESPPILLSDEIPNVDLTLLPQIDYASINSQWYDAKIEMLIITPDNQGFVDAVQPLMDWKNEKGVKTIILSNFSSYSGSDKAEQVRNMIKSYNETENIQWVLLAGDAGNGTDEIPIREVYNPDVVVVGETETVGDQYYKPTDFYYADLTGNWDDNDNDIWGESATYSGGVDEIDWTPDVYVGRLPADNAIELGLMINKTLKYETDPFIGDWMNNMLLAGGVSDLSPVEDEAVLTTYIWNHFTKHEMNFTHMFRESSPYDPPNPPAPNDKEYLVSNNLATRINSGYSAIIAAGHGAPTLFNDVYGDFYTSGEAAVSSNTNMPSLFYGDACTTAPYDKNANDNNMGETLIKRPTSGAIGYIGGLRVTWYFEDDDDLVYLNRANARLFWTEFFQNKIYQQGKALYDSKVAYMKSDIFSNPAYSIDKEWQRKNVLTYMLLGDPEVDIYTNKPGNLTNYFAEDYYEGQLVSFIVRDNNSRVIPYARVHLNTTDGKFRTVYADINGIVNFRLPKQANESYDVIMTGHNLIPTRFNFTTLPDPVKPELLNADFDPHIPSVSDNVCFNIEAFDNYSGVESVFVFFSDDNFKTYQIYQCSNESQENENMYIHEIYKLDPGVYSYLIVARDYANNTEIFYQNSFSITISTPLTDYILFAVSIMIVAIAGVSIFMVITGKKKHERIIEQFERM